MSITNVEPLACTYVYAKFQRQINFRIDITFNYKWLAQIKLSVYKLERQIYCFFPYELYILLHPLIKISLKTPPFSTS